MTELPVDLLSLITRLRQEGSQLDDGINSASHPKQGHPEPVAAVYLSYAELPVLSMIESLHGVLLNNKSPTVSLSVTEKGLGKWVVCIPEGP